jgi:hypothetical protein
MKPEYSHNEKSVQLTEITVFTDKWVNRPRIEKTSQIVYGKAICVN